MFPSTDFFDPLFPVSILDVVMMGRVGRSWGGPFTREDREIAANAFRDVDLYHKHQTAFADLSGGQRQRTLIARTLASSTELLFFDEPTANVDSFAEQNIYNLLRKLTFSSTVRADFCQDASRNPLILLNRFFAMPKWQS